MVSLGYGNSYGGFGAQVAYKYNKFAFHAGAGYFDPDLLTELSFIPPVILTNAGIKYYLNQKETLYMDLSAGTYGVEGYSYWSGNYSDSEWTYILGPQLSGGLDYYFLDNLGLNLGMGLGINFNHQDYAPDLGIFILSIDVGINFRILP